MPTISYYFLSLGFLIIGVAFYLRYLIGRLSEQRLDLRQLLSEQQTEQQQQRERFDEHQIKSLALIQDSLQKAMIEVRLQLTNSLTQHTQQLNERIEKLTQETQNKLKDISQEVDKQLAKGFEKTTLTFTDVIKRLAVIDEAQKKIAELSGNVVSLQEVLTDKRSRGAFGEVQLAALVRNMIPETHFKLQHTFSNEKRADCLLLLPDPTGNIAIDAKFPLESYRTMTSASLTEAERKKAETQFKIDIRKHIQDIAERYIIPGETSDGAMMFIPAEAIFAEIHARHGEIIDIAHQQRVWLVSPTTLMAILTTTRAVLKDAATRQQIHIIQKHLVELAKDFERFDQRMKKLNDHIQQAQQDVTEVHISSQKISSRFQKIEQVELPIE